jgi:serine/threonine protein kinase
MLASPMTTMRRAGESESISTVPCVYLHWVGLIFQVHRYTLKQEIGRGSFGAVHLAEDQLGNKYVMPSLLRDVLSTSF